MENAGKTMSGPLDGLDTLTATEADAARLSDLAYTYLMRRVVDIATRKNAQEDEVAWAIDSFCRLSAYMKKAGGGGTARSGGGTEEMNIGPTERLDVLLEMVREDYGAESVSQVESMLRPLVR